MTVTLRGNRLVPSTQVTWSDLEELFSGCSAQWDAQGGSEWLGDNSPTFVVEGTNLAVGYRKNDKNYWALWSERTLTWLFVPRPVNLVVTKNRKLKLEAP